MRNIAILTYSLTDGGAERIAGLLSKYLSTKYNVYLFLCDTRVISYEHAGTIVDLSQNGEENIESTLAKCKEEYNIDCAISFLIVMNCLNVRTRKNEKVILSSRCAFGEVNPFAFGDSTKIKTWYPKADRIVACSYGTEYDLVNNYGIDAGLITTIYNYVDKEKIRSSSLEKIDQSILNFIGSSKVIINVGRLDDQKNQSKLLTQFTKLIERGLDVKLLIIGSGYLEEKLKSKACALGVSDRVEFVTYSKNPFPYYKIADVMAFSTDYEGLPNVVLEAMTMGLPVVSTDCLAGPMELLKDEFDYNKRVKGVEICKRGILVEQAISDEIGDTDYLASGIETLLKDSKLYASISESELAYMEAYSNENIFSKWISVIEDTKIRNSNANLQVLSEINTANKVIVYGAGVYGKVIMRYLLSLNKKFDLLCFAVTSKNNNQEKIYDVPVFSIEELLSYKDDAVVVISVSSKFEKEVINKLQELEFNYIFSDI